MKRFINKKVVAIGVAAGLTLGMAGAAFAYFTSTGAGNGSASVGTTGSNIAVEGTSTPSLVPGKSTTMSFTAYNYANFNQAITTINLSGVVACKAALATPATTSFTSAKTAPTCSDTDSTLVANDHACEAGLAGSDATTDWFSMPAVSENDGSGSFDLAPATGSTPSSASLPSNGTITMNDLDVNQDACQGLNLSFQFTTS